MVKIQSFLAEFYQVCVSIIRILLMSTWNIHTIKNHSKKNCIILGNGPSLSNSIKIEKETIITNDLFCVNLFPLSDLYEELKPKYCILAAPEFFIKNVEEVYLKTSKDLFEALKNKTSWELQLFVINIASKHNDWKEIIKENKNIQINYFNPTPIEGWKWFRHLFFKLDLGMPRPHNILIPSIMIAINKGYSKIFLLGADHSWLSEISVDENNRVLVNQKHFYNENTSKPEPMKKLGKGERHLHEVLIKFVHTFNGYFVIREYAESRNSSILNATKNSYIDAFDRAKEIYK